MAKKRCRRGPRRRSRTREHPLLCHLCTCTNRVEKVLHHKWFPLNCYLRAQPALNRFKFGDLTELQLACMVYLLKFCLNLQIRKELMQVGLDGTSSKNPTFGVKLQLVHLPHAVHTESRCRENKRMKIWDQTKYMIRVARHCLK